VNTCLPSGTNLPRQHDPTNPATELNTVIPGANALAYGSLPKRRRRKLGRLSDSDAEAVAAAREKILAIVEDLDSELQLGGPDGVWRAMGLTQRTERVSQLWNAFQARSADQEGKGDRKLFRCILLL